MLPPAAPLTTKDLEPLKADLKCKICAMLFEEPVVLSCGHVFCRGCALENLRHAKRCPLCRVKYTHRTLQPCEPIAEMCRLLGVFGEQLGVADIAATQMSQPMVFKPFVPLQRPVPALAPPPPQSDMLSQCLRQAKSQRPFLDPAEEDEDEEDDDSEPEEEEPRHVHAEKGAAKGKRKAKGNASSGPPLKRQKTAAAEPTCAAGHPLTRVIKKGWLCVHAAAKLRPCASGMAAKAPRARSSMACEECGYYTCLMCYNRDVREGKAMRGDADSGSGSGSASESSEPASSASTASDSDKESSVESTASEEEEEEDVDVQGAPKNARCILCRTPARGSDPRAAGHVAQLLKKGIGKAAGTDATGGVLGPADPTKVLQKLGNADGPYEVSWQGGWKLRNVPLSAPVRKTAWAHDLCLLWCPRSRSDDDGRILPRTVAPAVRAAMNRKCAVCGGFGAGVSCSKPGCKLSFHVPCGLFTPRVAHICPETFTIYCRQHAPGEDRGRKKKGPAKKKT
eukprot:TRINITY_DN13254_c0_g2_i1.p2 TRINITY_DN13254_c0_g2~~TRINITY_DN13254_c0_g2_i1.p2  ORF type:complete len:509 (+),score=154.16 TRINITY_DN13254_c0_g2_i1:77-1603(+)